jgi:hypothetical protein
MSADRDASREPERPPEAERLPAAAPLVEGMPARVLGLQRSAGNQAVTRMVAAHLARAPLSMPLAGGTRPGAPYTELATFLEVIRAEEAKLPIPEQMNTRLMVTRIRKLFYGGKGWDKYLIPGAADVDPLYKFEETETKREEVEIDGAPNIDHVEKKPSLVGAPAALANPGSFQEVKMPNGDFVDVGHVLAGLDAFDHPSAAEGPFGKFSVSSNVAAVTWLGDIASIAGEAIIAKVKAGKGTMTDAEIQAQIDSLAPSQDMLGNIDAYVIHDAFVTDTDKGKKVSDILADYYGVGGAGATVTAHDTRFTKFTAMIGLGGLVGSSFANEAAWKQKWLPELRNTTRLYTASATDSHTTGLGMPSRLGFATGAGDNAINVKLLDLFVAELKTRVAAETKAAVPAAP